MPLVWRRFRLPRFPGLPRADDNGHAGDQARPRVYGSSTSASSSRNTRTPARAARVWIQTPNGAANLFTVLEITDSNVLEAGVALLPKNARRPATRRPGAVAQPNVPARGRPQRQPAPTRFAWATRAVILVEQHQPGLAAPVGIRGARRLVVVVGDQGVAEN